MLTTVPAQHMSRSIYSPFCEMRYEGSYMCVCSGVLPSSSYLLNRQRWTVPIFIYSSCSHIWWGILFPSSELGYLTVWHHRYWHLGSLPCYHWDYFHLLLFLAESKTRTYIYLQDILFQCSMKPSMVCVTVICQLNGQFSSHSFSAAASHFPVTGLTYRSTEQDRRREE